MQTVGVVGGGISGLVAAWHLITAHPDLRVTVFEASDRVGGKLRQEEVAGHRVDVGAESALWRRPEVVELLAELGVGAVHPQRFPALLWSRGRLETLPSGTLMGIPSEPERAAGLLAPDEVERARHERPVSVRDDISVGEAVEQAVGPAVVDRMVEPLLGGVYAGHARELSAQACVPALFRALEAGTPLTSAAAAASSAVSSTDQRQVFGAPEGGMGSLPGRLAQALRDAGVEIVTGAEVTSIRRALGFKNAWQLDVEIDGLPEPRELDGVVIAVPAPVAAQLVPVQAEEAAEILGAVECASMAIVTYGFDAGVAERLPDGTGFLVPPVDGHTIKASTFSSIKWPWLAEAAPDATYVRVSLGRHRETAVLEHTDAELARLGLQDLSAALGTELPEPLDVHVMRWTAALPQYAVGHTERMARVAESVHPLPALALAGAVYGGVGIPACVATARVAADSVLADLASMTPTESTLSEGAGR